MFKKSDLKNGDVVLLRDGDVGIAIPDVNVVVFEDGWDELEAFNIDMSDSTSDLDNSFDIVKVRRPMEPSDCCFKAFERGLGELVYVTGKESYLFDEICQSLKDVMEAVKKLKRMKGINNG